MITLRGEPPLQYRTHSIRFPCKDCAAPGSATANLPGVPGPPGQMPGSPVSRRPGMTGKRKRDLPTSSCAGLTRASTSFFVEMQRRGWPGRSPAMTLPHSSVRANARHCEPTGRANARPMTGSAKQSSRAAKRFWIASSLSLLAMTGGRHARAWPKLPPPQPSPTRGEGAKVVARYPHRAFTGRSAWLACGTPRLSDMWECVQSQPSPSPFLVKTMVARPGRGNGWPSA